MQLLPPPTPTHVYAYSKQQHAANHHLRGAAREAEPDQAVRQQRDHDGPHDRLADGTPAAADAEAADQRRRYHGEFKPESGVGPGAGQPRGVERANQSRKHAGHAVVEANRAGHGNAGVASGAARTAYRRNAPTDAQARQHDLRNNRHDGQHQEAEGDAQKNAGADIVPGRGVHAAGGDLHGIDLRNRLAAPARRLRGRASA